jgi:hypothetical protein
LLESPRHDLVLRAERILMVDVASTQARAKGVAPFASREGGQTEAGAAKPMSASPLPTADGVDKMYHQLAEIHAITAAHLAEWAHCIGLTQLLVWFGLGPVARGPP